MIPGTRSCIRPGTFVLSGYFCALFVVFQGILMLQGIFMLYFLVNDIDVFKEILIRASIISYV